MIETPRLRLRAWRDADRAPFAAITRDPEVMVYLGGVQDGGETNAAIDRQMAAQTRDGHCFWVLETRDDGVLRGFCGLRRSDRLGATSDYLEIGWRMARAAWGKGYAREAAEAALDWGFANRPVDRIVAWTVPANTRSWGLMHRIGMTARPDLDFDHPDFPDGHPLRRHVVYAADRAS